MNKNTLRPVYLPITSSVSWLHTGIDRLKAIHMLSDYGSDDGTFLVRESKKKKNTLVLSMCCDKKHFHFEIEKRGIYYFLDQVKYGMLPTSDDIAEWLISCTVQTIINGNGKDGKSKLAESQLRFYHFNRFLNSPNHSVFRFNSIKFIKREFLF